jgi:hypothetical protein
MVEEKPTGARVFIKKVPNPSSAAFGAKVKLDRDGQVASVSWQDTNQEIPVEFLEPDTPRVLPLYTVKAITPGGVLVQIPLEDQINNHGAAPDALPYLRTLQRRGYTILMDMEEGRGVFCPAGDCWAAWNDQFGGFCSPRHRQIANPVKTNPAGMFTQGVTTSRSAYRQE